MYADQATEQKLVQAIKEAAQRIDYASPDDPEAILADCLMKRGLHEGFAKTAANAINKSYSVYYMSTHDDSDRDADHRLLDGDKVKVHMCKEDIPACPHTSKPVEPPVIVSVKRMSTIGKAASENKKEYTPRQFRSDVEYLDWLSNGLYKFACAFDTFYADTKQATENIYGRHKQAREMNMDDYTVQCIMSHNHRDTNELLNTLGYTKKQSKVAMFGTGKVQELPRIIPDNNTSATIFSLVRDAGIIKTAHNSVNYMLKEASELKDCLNELINTYEKKCITKSAASPADTGPKFSIPEAISTGTATVPAVIAGSFGGLTGGLTNILENAANAASSDTQSVASSSVLDTELLKEDRRVKNLEAWAEVAADPDLARYPITDLFEVTQKLIKANPQFERPDAAPMLVDTVKQVMSQGGAIGLAMHGATAKTLSDIAKARGSNITGNDLYGIRSTITGTKEQGKFFNIADLFKSNATEMEKSLQQVPSLVKGVNLAALNGIQTGIDKVRNMETNKLKKEYEKLQLKDNIRKFQEAEQKRLDDKDYNEELDSLRKQHAMFEAKENIRKDQESVDNRIKKQEDAAKYEEDRKLKEEQDLKDQEARDRKSEMDKKMQDFFVNKAMTSPTIKSIMQKTQNILNYPELAFAVARDSNLAARWSSLVSDANNAKALNALLNGRTGKAEAVILSKLLKDPHGVLGSGVLGK